MFMLSSSNSIPENLSSGYEQKYNYRMNICSRYKGDSHPNLSSQKDVLPSTGECG
jgi:hypothetical protein